MDLYLVDGTYELFRAHFGYPSKKSKDGVEVGATKGYINHLLTLKKKYEYLCVSFDHTVESFRNKLFEGYKSSVGIDKEILNQFKLAEEVTKLLGIKLLSMTKYEADDGIASVCKIFSSQKNVNIVIGSLDKDLMQCIHGNKVIMYSTRYKSYIRERDVIEKYGIKPKQIPDFLAIVGDNADGYPGMKGIGEKTASQLLNMHKNIDEIYSNRDKWSKKIRSGERHSETIGNNFKLLKLYKELSTLKTDVKVSDDLSSYKVKNINKRRLQIFSDKYSLNL
jgi:5'-3' exonuclease